MADPGLTWRDGAGTTLDLSANGVVAGGDIVLLELEGTALPEIDNRVIVTPDRDGSVWINNRQQERFVVATIELAANGWATMQTLRRLLIQRINPRLGLGVLTYAPDATAYALDAVVERAAYRRGEDRGEFSELWVISWRCPNPLWRSTTRSTAALVIGDSGVSVPISVPLSIAESAQTATIVNSGDAISYPTVTVAGPITGPRIRNDTTAAELHFPALVIAAGQTLTVDMEEQTATVGQTNVMSSLTPSSAFWGLGRGNTSVICETSVGATTFTFAYYLRYEGV